MRHPRITAATIVLAVGAAVGGVAIAAAADSSSGSGTSTSATPRLRPAAVQTATVVVQGSPETILEDANGLPLYTYQPDTATTSHVMGQLAVLWPPLVGTNPSGAGLAGTLRTVHTANGQQVSYNGHFLYTFVEDSPGRVTGQGVQSFSVATPDLAALAAAPAGSTGSYARGGYGY